LIASQSAALTVPCLVLVAPVEALSVQRAAVVLLNVSKAPAQPGLNAADSRSRVRLVFGAAIGKASNSGDPISIFSAKSALSRSSSPSASSPFPVSNARRERRNQSSILSFTTTKALHAASVASRSGFVAALFALAFHSSQALASEIKRSYSSLPSPVLPRMSGRAYPSSTIAFTARASASDPVIDCTSSGETTPSPLSFSSANRSRAIIVSFRLTS